MGNYPCGRVISSGPESESACVADRTSLAAQLPRDQWLIGATLAAVIALCWSWIVPMALDMYGSMTGWSAWMMTRRWDFTHQVLLFAMWAVMMIGMMLPSVMPTSFLYAAVIRKYPQNERAHAHVYAFVAGYLFIWTVFSLFATVLQLLLAHWLLLTSMMEVRNRWLAGALWLTAGAYQFTPFKRACLECCRSPAAFITHGLKLGIVGGFRTGATQGLNCVACCWALMLLLFIGGVMNLWWISALTILVLLEKLAPLAVQGGRVLGGLIFAAGLWTLIRI
jgi:predicted metal-binding membrane protein